MSIDVLPLKIIWFRVPATDACTTDCSECRTLLLDSSWRRVDTVSLTLVKLHWLPVESRRPSISQRRLVVDYVSPTPTTVYQGREPTLRETFPCHWTVCLELSECLRMFDSTTASKHYLKSHSILL